MDRQAGWKGNEEDMNFQEWQAMSGAYWPSRKERLIYAIQHDDGVDEFGRLPLMQWLRTLDLMGEIRT